MIEIESIKNKFNDKWWDLLSHHFSKKYMQDIYTRIKSDISKEYKVLPSSNDIYQRFKLINPDDVRVVFLTEQPICSYRQSDEWKLMQRIIENECYDGLNLNLEDNIDYLIKDGVINLSPSLTICNGASDHTKIGWDKFVLDVMNILQKTGNKILFVCQKSDKLNVLKSTISSNNICIDLEPSCFFVVNEFLQKEYNLQIKW